MPLDLGALVDPAHTAVVTSEVQNGVVGARSALPATVVVRRPALHRARQGGSPDAAGLRLSPLHPPARRSGAPR